MVDYPAWFWSSELQASVKLVGGVAALRPHGRRER